MLNDIRSSIYLSLLLKLKVLSFEFWGGKCRTIPYSTMNSSERGSLDQFEHRAHGIQRAVDVDVDATYQSDEDDAQHTQDEAGTLAPVALDGGNDAVVLTQEHGLDHQQVVVERDDGVDQRDEHEHVDGHRALMAGADEDEELAEEACKRGIPPSENIASIIVKASHGLVLNKPL